jgi:hypothetical protein
MGNERVTNGSCWLLAVRDRVVVQLFCKMIDSIVCSLDEFDQPVLGIGNELTGCTKNIVALLVFRVFLR